MGLFRMDRACVSNLNLLVYHRVLSVCCTGVDSVDVVDAAADGVLLDDSDTHRDVVDFEAGVWKKLSSCCR